MISEAAQSLVQLIKQIPSDPFGSEKRVGLALGGTSIDPLMVKVATPAAWVIYVGSTPQDQPNAQISCIQNMSYTFVIKVVMDYVDEQTLLAENYPLLELIRRSVHNQVGPNGAKWRFEGELLEEITDRLIFEQRYSLAVPS